MFNLDSDTHSLSSSQKIGELIGLTLEEWNEMEQGNALSRVDGMRDDELVNRLGFLPYLYRAGNFFFFFISSRFPFLLRRGVYYTHQTIMSMSSSLYFVLLLEVWREIHAAYVDKVFLSATFMLTIHHREEFYITCSNIIHFTVPCRFIKKLIKKIYIYFESEPNISVCFVVFFYYRNHKKPYGKYENDENN